MNRPNVVLIHTDQQRWDTIAANGNRIIKTPNLDRLAARSVNFTNCYAQNPVCMPSRISLMTGRYCSSLRITHMAVTVPQDTTAIQHLFARSGYRTGLIGKLHYLPHSNRRHNRPHPNYGFDHVELSDEPGCYDDAYRAWVRLRAPDQVDAVSLGLPPVAEEWRRILGVDDGITHPQRTEYRARSFPADSRLTHAAFVGEQTAQFISEHKREPFFCFSGFYSPHSPWVAPDEYLSLYRDADMPLPHYPEEYPAPEDERFSEETLRSITKGYYAMISEVDNWVGEILSALDRADLADRTIIVFTSDHGEWLGEHRRFGKGFWAPDVVSRVPLIVSVPESLGGLAGEQVSQIVECVDVVPTLLRLCGLPVPEDVQGDVLPVSSVVTPSAADALALTEHHGWRSLRSDEFRYVVRSDGEEHLYDIAGDQWEYSDVAADPDHAELLSAARHELVTRMLRIEQPLPREWPY